MNSRRETIPGRRWWIGIAALLLSPAACHDVGQEPPGTASQPTVLSVSPDTGRPADPVIVRGKDIPVRDVLLFFGGVRCEPESIRQETVFARVPWGATSGPVLLATPTGSVMGPWFTVITPCPDSMCIVAFTGPPVTRSTAMHYDPMYGQLDSIPWTARVHDDTVECVQAYPVGDDSHWALTLRFQLQGLAGFPHSVGGILVRREIEGVFTEELRGVIAIQDWDLAGVISGRISFVRRLPDGWYVNDFWYRFQE